MTNIPICQSCGRQYDLSDYLDQSAIPQSIATWEDCGTCDCGGQILGEPI